MAYTKFAVAVVLSCAVLAAQAAQVTALMSVISIYKHRQNIGRLLKGTESKIGAKG